LGLIRNKNGKKKKYRLIGRLIRSNCSRNIFQKNKGDDEVEAAKAHAWCDEETPNHADTMLILMKEMRGRLTLLVIKRWATRWQCIKKRGYSNVQR